MENLRESAKLIIRSLRRFLSLSFILASMIFMVRLYELFFTSGTANYPLGSTINMLIGLKYDLILYLRISAVLMIPFLIIAYFSQKAAKIFFIVLSILLIFGDMLLLQYFGVTRVPLGADLFGYSPEEIKQAAGASGKIDFVFYFLLIIYFGLMARVFIRHVYFRIKPWAMALLTILMAGSLLPIKQLSPEPSKFNDEFSMFIATNKLNFFFQSTANRYLYQGGSGNQTYTFKATTASSDGNPFVYIDPDYPFLHQESTPDILGGYFDLKETPPNIVFIIVESLGRAYSGEGAYLGSYTPFLDSLSQKSLYWENNLSTSGRTFQVLPSLLASAPFGSNGFAEMADKMPGHLSLPSILKKQAGYSSSFVYGGEAEFDKMDIFLRRQGVDKIIDSKDFGKGYTKLPAAKGGFSWGYGDKDIFSRYLEDIKSSQDTLRLDVLLTLAMHDPFFVPGQEYYNQKFEEKLNSLDLTGKVKTFDAQYPLQFASVLYFDESLRFFFMEASKLPSFGNTIFIITGDHRMPEIPISTQIDRFHVPLVIYSPLLKKARKFSSVVTHFDVAPSLVALLDGAKHIVRPSVASWVGYGLDNSVSFRNLNSYPLMRNKNEILDFIDSEYFLSAKTLYKIYPNLDIEPLDSSELQQQLKDELGNFIRKNNYACQNNKLIPDSLQNFQGKGGK